MLTPGPKRHWNEKNSEPFVHWTTLWDVFGANPLPETWASVCHPRFVLGSTVSDGGGGSGASGSKCSSCSADANGSLMDRA